MLTNKHGIPEPLFNAIANDEYSHSGDISVTELLSPPQLRALRVRHKDEIDSDIIEYFWAACGKAMHTLLAKNTGDGGLVSEKRMDFDVDGWKVSGQMDLYDPVKKKLSDYKFVGCYAYKMAAFEGKPEWEAQLNIYRWLLAKTENIVADQLEIVCLIRDWMQSQVGKADYPVIPVQRVNIPVWKLEETEDFIRRRIAMHKKAAEVADDALPPCSDEERWLRKGKAMRCASYCPVRTVCHQNIKSAYALAE